MQQQGKEGGSYVSITGLLERVRADLPLGQMVHTETFSLFEAMSAVELGNEKMDAAMSGSCKSADELIQEGVAPVEGLTPAQLLLIMERLLVMEVCVHLVAHGACASPLQMPRAIDGC